MEPNSDFWNRHIHMDNGFSTQVQWEFSGERTALSRDAGTTRKQYVQ